MLADTMHQMKADGVKRALAFATSAYSSYSSCRQYRENIAAAQAAAGEGAPAVDKLRVFHNHPLFVEANIEQVRSALDRIPAERRAPARIAYTAHSIPQGMADSCNYQRQLMEVARLVSDAFSGPPIRWSFRAAAARHRSRGWGRTSSTICGPFAPRARPMS